MRSQSELLGQQIEFRPAFDTCPFHFTLLCLPYVVEESPTRRQAPNAMPPNFPLTYPPFPVGHVLLLPDVSDNYPFHTD